MTEQARNSARIAVLAVVGLLLTVVVFTHGRPFQHSSRGVNPSPAESLIYGRLARSETDGILSSGALLGHCSRGHTLVPWSTPFQKRLYEAGRCDEFTIYYSQTGLQGMLFSALDQLGAPVAVSRAIAASCMALALTLLFAWVSSYFGLPAALIGIALTLLHRWPMLLGDNLYMMFGLMYMPMLVLFWALRRGDRRIVLLTTGCLTARWLLTGAEFLFAGLAMSFVPLVFYAVERRYALRELASLTLRISAGTAISLVICGAVLVLQIASQSSFEHAREHFTYTIGKRTWGDPASYPRRFGPDLTVPTGELLRKYLAFPAIQTKRVSVSFLELMIIQALFTALAVAIYLRSRNRALLAFIVVTWLSSIAPLSWIVIAKAHAHRHVWLDPIVWYMPFLLLGNALAGIVIARTPGFVRDVLRRRSGEAISPDPRAAS